MKRYVLGVCSVYESKWGRDARTQDVHGEVGGVFAEECSILLADCQNLVPRQRRKNLWVSEALHTIMHSKRFGDFSLLVRWSATGSAHWSQKQKTTS